MENILTVLLLTFVIGCGSCTTATKNVIPSYDHLTVQAVIDKCNSPVEVHDVPAFRFPMVAKVIRHSNCLGVNDVLMVTFPGDSSEKHMTGAKLLMLMYVEYQNATSSDEIFSAKFLKLDQLGQSGEFVNIVFYEIKKTQKPTPKDKK